MALDTDSVSAPDRLRAQAIAALACRRVGGSAGPTIYAVGCMPSADDVKQRIESGIPGSIAEIETTDEVHFSARVVAPAFAGVGRVQQHRMVYDLFGPGELGGSIHALSLKTETP